MTAQGPIPGQEATRAYPVRVGRWLPAVAVAVALLYALAIGGEWAITPTSGVYLTVGRNLAEGRGMVFNGRPMPRTPPLLPALVAGCRLLAGRNALWLLNTLMSLCAVGAALAAMGTANRLGRSRPAPDRIRLAIGTFLMTGLSAWLFGDATCLPPEVPLVCLFMLGVYAFVRSRTGHWAWCPVGAAALAAAACTHFLGLVLLPAVLIGVVLEWNQPQYRKRLLATLFAGAAIAAAAGLWLYAAQSGGDVPAPGGPLRALWRYPSDLLAPAGWNRLAANLARLPEAVAGALTDQELHGVNVIPAALAVVGLAVGVWQRQWVVVLPVVGCVACLLALRAEIGARYLVPLLPLVAYFVLTGTHGLARTAVRWVRSGIVRRRAPRLAVVAAAGACLVISLPKDVRRIVWARHPDFYRVYEHGKWQGVVQVSEALARRGRPGADTVATPEHPVVHYLTRLPVVEEPIWTDGERAIGMGDTEQIPPEAFARAAQAGSFRFLVVPTRDAAWSGPALEAVARTGAFAAPRHYADMALLERVRGLTAWLPADAPADEARSGPRTAGVRESAPRPSPAAK